MSYLDQFQLKEDTRYIYTFFVWTASNCAPNRDGGTGEIRVDSKKRVFTTQECFNQNIKNGIFFASKAGRIPEDCGAELLGCKNAHFQPTTLQKAQLDLLERIANITDKKTDELGTEEIFKYCFDIPLLGLVNSNGVDKTKYPAFDFKSVTGSAGLIYLPKTVTPVSLDNRGISNSFAQKEGGMPGSHYTDYLEEGVFSCLGFFNVAQLEMIAERVFKITDKKEIHNRVEALYRLYLTGIWEGFKLLGYASVLRKGQQPFSLSCVQKTELPDYISDPADILMKDNQLPFHVSFENTIADFEEALTPWKENISKDWQTIKKAEL
jgi:hypothetical protein